MLQAHFMHRERGDRCKRVFAALQSRPRHSACRTQRPHALCGIARLKGPSIRISVDQFELPTHASMLEVLSAQHQRLDFTSDFDEVLADVKPEVASKDNLADIKGDRNVEDSGVYDNLVRTAM